MGLNRPTQQLLRELLNLAYHRETQAGKLFHIADIAARTPVSVLLELLVEIHADHLYVKRLQRQIDGSISVISANPAYQVMSVSKDNVEDLRNYRSRGLGW